MRRHTRLDNFETTCIMTATTKQSSEGSDQGFALRLWRDLKTGRVSRQGWGLWQPFVTLVTKLSSARLDHLHLAAALEKIERALGVNPGSIDFNGDLGRRRGHVCQLLLQTAALTVGHPPLNLYRDPDFLHLNLSLLLLIRLASELGCCPPFDNDDLRQTVYARLIALPPLPPVKKAVAAIPKPKARPRSVLPCGDLVSRIQLSHRPHGFVGGRWDPEMKTQMVEACKRLIHNKPLPPGLNIPLNDPLLKLTRAVIRARPDHPHLEELSQRLCGVLKVDRYKMPVAMLMEVWCNNNNK
ncbi:protein ORF43 [Lake sturgeon herpesvirus]|nr:protein ORF43 [Lake sturgeon herpesvirus]